MPSISSLCLRVISMQLLAGLLLPGSCRAAADEPESTEVSAGPLFVLAGDSTVTDRAGWGAGFRELLADPQQVTNLAQSGRSSRSFRAEGWWQKCLEAKPKYLLIQFGHNDQPGKGPNRESKPESEFRDHLRGYVREAREAGIIPVLVTSLTRRRWNSDGTIAPSLTEYAEATAAVAAELNAPLIPLHRLSIAQCEAFGPTAFRKFEPMKADGADHTHLNPRGSRVVAALVVTAMISQLPDLATVFDGARLRDYSGPNSHSADLTAGSLRLLETEETIDISSNGMPLLTYRKVSPAVPEGIKPIYHRSGFLHPLTTPRGLQVTAAFPADHPHQHGVFSAWTKTTWNDRQIDFWNLAGGTGRVLHQQVVSTSADQESISFEVDLIHRAVQDPVVDVLNERWSIRVSRGSERHFCFDLSSVQFNQTDLPLVLEDYHYGGMAIRGPVQWLSANDRDVDATKASPALMTNEFGSDRKTGNHEHTRWVVMAGSSDGRTGGVAVLCHPSNFRAPQAARLHPTKPYFVFSPCADGQFQIGPGETYRARYRYLIFDGNMEQDWLQEQWEQYASEAGVPAAPSINVIR